MFLLDVSSLSAACAATAPHAQKRDALRPTSTVSRPRPTDNLADGVVGSVNPVFGEESSGSQWGLFVWPSRELDHLSRPFEVVLDNNPYSNMALLPLVAGRLFCESN